MSYEYMLLMGLLNCTLYLLLQVVSWATESINYESEVEDATQLEPELLPNHDACETAQCRLSTPAKILETLRCIISVAAKCLGSQIHQ